ncbi:uncharacterized protein EDB91DRAFT_1249469 [Suillus paluster]|uniref:uncharacterized protein n=1 Tax=Suillus paluster TaxID=48578 RepID=UPI001B873ED7|nr:uncharacterized protein EDB91DRAFT_1249469 [Suillus paluster]KAG1738151.1 hypothetical protein EDB91DRAFT_1249469 [Suillus paluster]
MSDNIFHICQEATKEEFKVSKYYLDRRPLKHVLQTQLPMQQFFEPPPKTESIEIGNIIYYGFSRIHLAQTIKYTKDKGYDIRPGDFVNVARRLEYQATAVVQSVDFLMARLTLLSQTDGSLINVPMRFMVKTCNVSLDTFKNDIGKEVFIIQGQHKGYQATLYDIESKGCSVALHGQKRITLELPEVTTRPTTVIYRIQAPPIPPVNILTPGLTPCFLVRSIPPSLTMHEVHLSRISPATSAQPRSTPLILLLLPPLFRLARILQFRSYCPTRLLVRPTTSPVHS